MFLDPKTHLVHKNNLVLCYSPKPLKYIQDIQELPLQDVLSIEYAEDATLIRLFHVDGTWYTSTINVPDATNSYYNSHKSFDTLFWEIFDTTHLKILKLDSTYVFLLKHTSHTHVIQHKTNQLLLIEIISPTNIPHTDELPFHGTHHITTQFQNIQDKQLFIQNINVLTHKRGLLFLTHQFKYLLDFTHFKVLKQLRGKTPSLLSRYCQLYFKPQQKQLFLETFCSTNLHFYNHAHKILQNHYNNLPPHKQKIFKKSTYTHLLNILSN
jgi:hypothetical protein